MRRYGYLLLALVVLAMGVILQGWLTTIWYQMVSEEKRDMDKTALVARASLNTTILLDQEAWLTFPLPSGSLQVKLISNANTSQLDVLRAQQLADPTRRWNYAMEMEVLDDAGNVLLQRVHHHRADLAEIRLPDGQVVTPSFYLEEGLAPLSAAMVLLDLGGLEAPTRLRLRLVGKDPELVDISVRAFLPERNTPEKAALLWQRLSEKQKVVLARASVYPPELLLEQEKRDLLMHTWRAIGVKGSEGRDYRQRNLYVLLDSEGEIVDDPIQAFGLRCGPRLRATLPIPPEGGQLRLALTPASGGPPLADIAKLTVRWFGGSQFARKSWTMGARELAKGEVTLPMAGGLVEIDSPAALTARAFLRRPGARVEEEITPPAQYLRAFWVQPGLPLDYVLEEQRADSGFRVEIRRPRLGEALPGQQIVHYQVFDGADQVLKAGELKLNPADSYYDEVIGDYSGAWLSDPAVFHFSLPPAARRFRIELPAGQGGGVLVSAHTRPAGLSREIRLPEDNFDFDASGKRIPAWFPVRPEAYEAAIMNNRSRLLFVQPRPPEENTWLQAGNYQWEDFAPQGKWLARAIYVPREPEMPYREDSLPVSFSGLRPGKSEVLEFPAYQGLQSVQPRLVRIGDEGHFSARLQIDDAPPQTLRGTGPYSELTLPPLAVGKHRLRVDGEGRYYINFVRPQGDNWVRRIANRFDGSLEFVYDRRVAAEETLTLRLFQAPGAVPGRLSVHIAAPSLPQLTPLEGWVFSRRDVHIAPPEAAPGKIFDTLGERSDAGQALFIPFRADAPTGRYRIVVQAAVAGRAYLTVSRIGQALQATRRLHLQQESDHVLPPR